MGIRVSDVTRDVPNVLTVLRLIAVPIVVVCLLIPAGQLPALGGLGDVDPVALQWIAWWIFGLAAATDALDGYLARRWRVVSSFGKLADPLADKALVLGAMTCLAVVGATPWWPLIVVGIRELGVTVGRLAVAKDVVIPASRGGKLKTGLQIAALILLLLPVANTWVADIGWWALVASVVVAVVTGIDYARHIIVIVRRGAVPAQAPRVPQTDHV